MPIIKVEAKLDRQADFQQILKDNFTEVKQLRVEETGRFGPVVVYSLKHPKVDHLPEDHQFYFDVEIDPFGNQKITIETCE